MKITAKAIVKTATVLGCILLANAALHLWNKSDFCEGWSEHYRARAEETSIQMSNEAMIKKRQADLDELELAFHRDMLIAQKYRQVASNPFRAYPKKPLVTALEIDEFRNPLAN